MASFVLELNNGQRIPLLRAIPFAAVHLALLTVFVVDFRWTYLLLCLALYAVRMFFVTAGYHRYFSHRSFKTSRPFAFLLAFLGESTLQKGVLWWASHHRHHHRYSDLPEDCHSPLYKGFFWAHLGWILCEKYKPINQRYIRDFMAHKELAWLNDNTWLPLTVYISTLVYFFGLEGFLWGFVVSTVFLWHGTFSVNSLVHVWGTQPYQAGDNSRNNWVAAIFAMGDGWHNNHHYYPISVRHGFQKWEFDFSYYILCLLERLGIVWDLKRPDPSRIARDLVAGAQAKA